MSAETGRWLAPLASAAAVGTLVVGMSQLDHGSGGREPDRAPPSAAVPSYDLSGVAARGRTAARTSRDPRGVPLEGYSTRGRVLTLRYTITLRDCTARIRSTVVESTDTVAVTLRRVAPSAGPHPSCRPISLADSVDLTLRAPLGSRTVLDGSRAGVPVPTATRP
jgi:hypothetical protein